MRKVNLKRIALGSLVGFALLVGFVVSLMWWFNNPAFPGLWLSEEEALERKCAEDTSNQPYLYEGFLQEYFSDCLMREGESAPEIVPQDENIDGVG